MARPKHAISNLTFPILRGIVSPYKQMVEVIERKGTNDLLRRKTGFQSPEFVLESFVNLKNFSMAQAQVGSYVDTIESGALPLVKDDYDFRARGLLVVVLDVEPTIEKQRSLIVGGFRPDYHFELRCNWRLRFVAGL